MGFIRVVKYGHSSYASYDNRRRYWARKETALDCVVLEAGDQCHEDDDEAIVAWSCDAGTAVREARVEILDNRSWMALRCAQQGPDFSLQGEKAEPSIGSNNIPKFRKKRETGRRMRRNTLVLWLSI
jgi:hypothetical protein